MKKHNIPRTPSQQAERYSPDVREGLSDAQAARRVSEGLNNVVSASQGKSYGRILRDNLMTVFNLLNFALAACVILVGSYSNALFIGVIICNIIIGTYQEIRAKRTIEKLQVVSAPTAHVVRGGTEREIAVGDIVLDDIAIWRAGMQISADCEVAEGEIEVNESLLTGESDALKKRPGDKLMSGSFVVSGECRARVTAVGDESYAARIAGDAKVFKKPNSELMRSLNRIIKSIGVAIVPIGGALFLKQYYIMHMSLTDSVVKTVAAMIGMIPEGLILLTSVALAVGVIRLAQRKTLVQQLYCIETLARVDTLCLDKTGTITTGEMQVSDLVAIDAPYEFAVDALRAFTSVMTDDNPTSLALKKRFEGGTDWTLKRIEPFSSARKWSGAEFERYGSIIVGAPEFVLGEDYARVKAQVEDFAAHGQRVLVLAQADAPFGDRALPAGSINICALIAIGDTLRAEAPATLSYFADQGVDIKVISGDNPVTVSSVAARAGLSNADKLIDMSTLHTDEEVAAAATKYTVFGRVTPQQKRVLVNALKRAGHTVAMTGDGVNDVLALKDADCSIAMASGSDAARQVANIVLRDSNFASMPAVVAEGRRVINNITRSASLFLTKTIFSALLSVLLLIMPSAYPFQPIQLTLFSSLAIGLPSFVLALEPNTARVKGKFLLSVLARALPAALTIVLGTVACMIMAGPLGHDMSEVSTMAVIFTVCVGLISLARVCRPFNLIRAGLVLACAAAFAVGIFCLPGLFKLIRLDMHQGLILLGMVAAACPTMLGIDKLIRRIPAFAHNRELEEQ